LNDTDQNDTEALPGNLEGSLRIEKTPVDNSAKEKDVLLELGTAFLVY